MKKKVIIVGGGFAGIQLTRRLDDQLFDILLVDKINHHQFQPLLYQVATSQLEPSSISFPLRHLFRNKKNVQIRLGELLKVDTENSKINLDIGTFDYDYLVLAMGCTTNFYGNYKISQHALTLKTTFDAITIRNHLMQTFENILSAKKAEKESLLNIVIVGAGPTGVELAGAFDEIRKNVLPHDFHRINFSKLRIILIEGSKHTLNAMSNYAKNASDNYLREMRIDLRTETYVKDYDGETLLLSNGETIKTKTVIWAAGIIANKVKGIQEEILTKGNRIKVNRINKVEATSNVFAIGDLAFMLTPNYPYGHPQVANVAINQAKNLAANLKSIEQEKNTTDYVYKDWGSMATLARNKAVVDLPSAHFKGFFAWLVWMLLHLMLILSVRNKVIIFINWAWTYVTKDTALRLILKGSK